MMGRSRNSIYERAALRAAIVAIILIVLIEILRFAGRAAHIDRGEEMMIAIAGAGVYALVWAAMAALTARMMKKIEDAAKGDQK